MILTLVFGEEDFNTTLAEMEKLVPRTLYAPENLINGIVDVIKTGTHILCHKNNMIKSNNI